MQLDFTAISAKADEEFMEFIQNYPKELIPKDTSLDFFPSVLFSKALI